MNLYMKFLELSARVEFECDPNCISLLNEIALADSQGNPLSVMKAMALDSIASPATLHRRVDQLTECGYIFHTHKDGNRRTKYLIPALKAKSYFQELEKCLLHSIK